MKKENTSLEYFRENLTLINGLRYSFKSSLPPMSHCSCGFLIARKLAKILLQMRKNPEAEFVLCEDYEGLKELLEMVFVVFKPKFIYFEVLEIEELDLQSIKLKTNEILLEILNTRRKRSKNKNRQQGEDYDFVGYQAKEIVKVLKSNNNNISKTARY